jgi:hypothetical protein
MRTRVGLFALVLIGLACLAIRFIDLESNPPSWLSWSAAEYIDEGYKLHTARNLVLFGSPKWSELDEYGGGAGSFSIFSKIAIPLFQRYGIRLAPLRLFVAALGCLSAIALGCLIGRRFGPFWGISAGTLLSIDLVHLTFSRRALLEVPQALFVIILLGALLARGRVWWRALLGLLAFGIAYWIKPSAIVWLMAMVPGGIICFMDRAGALSNSAIQKRRLGRLVIAGILAGLLVYTVLWLTPADVYERAWYKQPVAEPSVIIGDNLLSPLARVNSLLVGAGIASSAFLLIRPLAVATPPGWILLGSWGLFGHLALALLGYNPVRYHIFLIPVFISTTIIAAYAVSRVPFSHVWVALPRWARTLIWVLFYYSGAIAAGGLVHLLARKVPIGTHPGLTALSSLLLGAGVAAFAAALLFLWRKRSAGRNGGAFRQPASLIVVLLLITGAFQIGELGAWWSFRSHTLDRAANRIEKILPADAIVAGPWAPALCFETQARTLYLGLGRNEASLSQIRPSHFLFVNTEEGEHLRDQFESGEVSGVVGMQAILQLPIDERWHVILYQLEWQEMAAFESHETINLSTRSNPLPSNSRRASGSSVPAFDSIEFLRSTQGNALVRDGWTVGNR